MTKNNLSHTGEMAAVHQKLTPNEKAIIDSIQIPVLRNILPPFGMQSFASNSPAGCNMFHP